MGTIEITDTITLPCTAGHAWDVIADYANDVRWRTGVLSMSTEPFGLVVPGAVTTERMRLAGEVWENLGEVGDVDVGRRFTWRTVSGADADGAREVMSVGDRQCEVLLELRVRPRGVERLFAPLLARMLRRNLRRDLERLREMIESHLVGGVAPPG